MIKDRVLRSTEPRWFLAFETPCVGFNRDEGLLMQRLRALAVVFVPRNCDRSSVLYIYIAPVCARAFPRPYAFASIIEDLRRQKELARATQIL